MDQKDRQDNKMRKELKTLRARLKKQDKKLKVLEACEKRYREIIDSVQDGYFEVDLAGNFIDFNETIRKRFGLPRDEMIGMNFRSLFKDDQADHIYRLFNKVYKTGAPVYIESEPVVGKDGKRNFVEVTVYLVRDEKGKPVGFRGLSHNVTVEKKTEKALRESERKYHNILETMEDGYYETDLKGTFLYFNAAAPKIYGYPAKDMIGMNHSKYTSKETAEKISKIYSKVYKTGVPAKVFGYDIIRKDNSPGYLEVSAALVRDDQGNPVGFRGMARDRTEEMRRKSELERYRDFVENVDEACFEVDLAGNITYCNESACRMIGYSRNELIGLSNRQYSTPESAKRIYRVFNAMYRTGVTGKMSDYEIIHKNGDMRYFDISASLIRDAKGEPIGFRGIARDITEQKTAEAEKRRLTEQLNRARKLEAVGTLAAGVAHDFNNLLMGIQGYASLMALEFAASDPHYERLKAIEALVQRGADLTRKMLGYAREGRYQIATTDLNAIIEKTAFFFERECKGIRIHQKLDPSLAKVEADIEQMEQVFKNLFSNASQAMPAGGSLYLKTENTVLDENFVIPHEVKAGPYIKISVGDTGTGMDKKTQERIFEPFFTTREIGAGVGLGLASVYGIVKGHGGIINVHSEVGRGTQFSIYLPILGSQKKTGQEKGPEPVEGIGTILVVDDEKAVTVVTRSMVNRLGYKAMVAFSGEDAVELYRIHKDKIGLVIMDMVMPGIGGAAAIEAIRDINPEIKIILSSGYSLLDEARAVMTNGAQGFLEKPFQLDSLAEKIKEVCTA